MLRPTWAEVDVEAMKDNVAALVAHTPSMVCAVVKGDGYGHGGVLAARAALAGGAKWLAVALVEEAVELREAGIRAPILLLSEPFADGAQAVVDYRITPTVYSAEGLRLLSERSSRSRFGSSLPVHLKVDTGLYRLGATPEDIPGLARLAADLPGVHVEGLFTHFAAASAFEPDFTAEQRRRLNFVVEGLRQDGLCPPMIHACNSAGITLCPDPNDALVRAGAVVYGIPPTAKAILPAAARPALALKSRVAFVKTVSAGESVAYGRSHQLGEDSVIATIPAGYADGVPRRLGLVGGEVLINGRRCRLAGPAAMDQVVVDCGPGFRVSRGDEVVFLGRQGEGSIGVADWAAMLELSPWEVLTGISKRVPRVLVNQPALTPAVAP